MPTPPTITEWKLGCLNVEGSKTRDPILFVKLPWEDILSNLQHAPPKFSYALLQQPVPCILVHLLLSFDVVPLHLTLRDTFGHAEPFGWQPDPCTPAQLFVWRLPLLLQQRHQHQILLAFGE